MLKNVSVFNHSSIRIARDDVIYFDPFEIKEEIHDADYIFITHDHFDHYSPEDIVKVKNEHSKIIVPKSLSNEVRSLFDPKDILLVEPWHTYQFPHFSFQTIPAYNPHKSFHPRKNQWVGYLLQLDYTYYIMGDTDQNSDNEKVQCDVLFIPVGGTYTFNVDEAVAYTQLIHPQVVVPTHYGSVAGKKEDGQLFAQKLKDIPCVCLLDE